MGSAPEAEFETPAQRARDWLGVSFDRLSEGLVLLSPDGSVEAMNARAEVLLGVTRAALLGRQVTEERIPGASGPFTEWVASARVVEGDSEGLVPFGELWLRVRLTPCAEGHALFLLDCTESRRVSGIAENLQDALDRMGEAFYTLDEQWRFTYCNRAAAQLMRHTASELVGTVVWEQFPDALGTIVEVEFTRTRDLRVPGAFEVYFPPLEGWFDVRVTPSQEGIAVHFRDITARKQADERLLEQATLLDHAQDAIFVRDLAHNIIYWSKGAERSYGWPASHAVGRSSRDLLYPEAEHASFEAATASVLEAGEWRGELRQRARDGRQLVVDGRWTVLRDPEGKPKSVLCINSDITEKKTLEKQFLRAQRLESLGTLAGGIAHDLNNVFAPIVMTASALAYDEPDPERAEDLALLQRSAERGADMVKQLLSFARGADGVRVPVELKHVVIDVQQILRDTFPKNITLQVHVAPREWTVEGDRTQLNQLLTNLCVNARDAMPNGGTLTIAVEHVQLDEAYAEMNLEAKPGPYVLLRVEDTGVGMAPEVLEHIFEPFFTTKEVGKGTGLGLSTVHALVRQHHGFIHVYSELGKGTRFKVYLPAQRTVGDGAATRAPEPPPRGNGELVLVVDDEAPIRTVASRTLQRHGYRVMVAANGAEAVAVYAQHRGEIAVVLTDMTMPVMDGPATILALRAINPEVRIVGSSGLAANGNVARAVDAGVRYFVPKPYTADVMLAVLRKALS